MAGQIPHEPRDPWAHQQLKRARKDPPLHLGISFPASRTVREKNVCYFRPHPHSPVCSPSALGNEHRVLGGVAEGQEMRNKYYHLCKETVSNSLFVVIVFKAGDGLG